MPAVKILSKNATLIGRKVLLMGCDFYISLVGADDAWANERINSAINEIIRVEKLLSPLTHQSDINEININAGIKPVRVDAEVFRLIDRSLQISDLTHGTFDISYITANKSLGHLSGNNKTLNKAGIGNYKNIVLDFTSQTVFLKNKGMCISFGAMSRGYAADRAKYILQMQNVSSGVINAGGDLLSWGLQPDNTPWTIAAADPKQAGQPFANINISNMAVATSFNAERLPSLTPTIPTLIDADNGFSLSGIASVSIITPGAELADAMATPVIAMGVNAGLYLINKLNQIACIIIDDHSRVYTSKSINHML